MDLDLLYKKTKNKNVKMSVTAIIVAILLPILFLLIKQSYFVTLGSFILLYVVAVSGLDIVFGYSGQISMGHAAFFAIGAYSTGILTAKLGIPLFISMICGSIAGALIGALLAYPASKLVFHFLSLSTISFGEIVYQLITHSPNGITGNFNGLRLGKQTMFGLPMDSKINVYYLFLVFVIIFLVAKHFLVNSKVGRAFVAIRENTHAAEGMGINVRKYKIIAFTVSAFFTAFAGGMFLILMGYIHPDSFLQPQSVLFLTMLLFGGTASIIGPIVGTASVQLLVEALRDFQDYQMFLYGALMLIVIVLIPGGIYGTIRNAFVERKQKKESGELDAKG